MYGQSLIVQQHLGWLLLLARGLASCSWPGACLQLRHLTVGSIYNSHTSQTERGLTTCTA